MVRTVQKECVCLLPARQTSFRTNCFEQLRSDLTQYFISVISAVALIDHAEMIDVDDHGIHFRVFVIMIVLLSIAVEELLVIQAGQRVPFCRLDYLSVFGQFDDTQHSCMYYVDSRIRFRDKVCSAKPEALYLRVFLRSHDDHRDMRQELVFLHRFQHIKA